MRREPAKRHMDSLLAVLVFGVFAACILLVLLAGADGYQRLAERGSGTYSRRTAAQYLATKVRQGDAAGRVYAGQFAGGDGDAAPDTLYLEEQVGEETYVTRIYWYDGYIRELFAAAETELVPADGEKVLAAGGLQVTQEDGLLCFQVTDPEGETLPLTLALRSGEGAAS